MTTGTDRLTRRGASSPKRPASSLPWPFRLLAIAALIVIAADAGLIPAARWQGDEYFEYWSSTLAGWRQVPQRVFGPSPRPLAELLGYLYLRLVHAAGGPLLVPVLATAWLAAAVPVVLVARRDRSGRDAILLLALFAILICLRTPSELLFWPVGLFAYLGGLSCLGAATLLLRRPLERGTVRVLCALLLVAASFDEMAASIVAIFGVLAVLLRIPAARGARPMLGGTALYAALICGGTFLHRMRPQDRVVHPGTGFLDALRHHLGDAAGVFWSILSGAPLPDAPSPSILFGRHAITGIVLLLVVAPGCARSPERPRPDRGIVLCWTVALLVGAFLSVLLAFEQFGAYCCERHSIMQSGLVLLAAFGLAGLVSLRAGAARTLLLAAVVLTGFLTSLGALRHDYALLPRVVAAREAAWRSLLAPGPQAEIRVLPRGRIVNSDALDTGRFSLPAANAGKGEQPPWDVLGIMESFGKQHLDVVAVPN